MTLVPWQFWLQIAAIIFAAGSLYSQLRTVKAAMRELATAVARDHDQLLKMEGMIEALDTNGDVRYSAIESRLALLERRCDIFTMKPPNDHR